jgi:hypothetical protein
MVGRSVGPAILSMSRYSARGSAAPTSRAGSRPMSSTWLLLDKEADVSFGVSKANSGIVHGGFHHNKKYLKARLEILGRVDVRPPQGRARLSLFALRHSRRGPARGRDARRRAALCPGRRERRHRHRDVLGRAHARAGAQAQPRRAGRPLRARRRNRRAIPLRVLPRRVRRQERRAAPS